MWRSIIALTKREEHQLNKIANYLQKIRQDVAKVTARPHKQGGKRRTADETKKMREDVLIARAKGVSARKLAKKYCVSAAYIYMIK